MKVPEIAPLTLVGPYRIVELVGRGARGVVYRAEELPGGRAVAVKVMGMPDDVDEAEARLRFERETQALSRFRHPHIVGFEGSGTLRLPERDVPYVAMEFLHELQPLNEASRQFGSLAWTLDRVEELLAALQYMHSHAEPVIHRDLKPANLGVPRDGRLKVLDLGLARVRASDLTHHGTFMGSMGYIAPEQVMDAAHVDHRADLYAVGMIILELVGGHPLDAMTSSRALRAILAGRIPPTPRPVPEQLDAFARRLASLHPNDRPPSAGQALHELRALRAGLSPTSLPQVLDQSPTEVGWESVVGYLRHQLALASVGQGGAVLVCGRSHDDRQALIHTVCRQAGELGIRVLTVPSSAALARALGCSFDEGVLFETLTCDAEDNPTLLCVPELPRGDAVLEHLMEYAVRSGEPLLVLASTAHPPPAGGRVTVFQMQ